MPARLLLLALAATLPFVDVLFAQPPARKPRKVALLVGVNEYTKRAGLTLDNLQFAEPDVTALAAELMKAGFEVTTLRGSDGIDPKKKITGKVAYFAALADVLTGVTKADTVLLAFSGHGAQLEVNKKESPFFCPADADPADADTLISINDVLAKLDRDGGGHNLVMVDACRNVVDVNRGGRGGINGSRIDNLPEGTAVFFSCSGRQKARETDKMFPEAKGKKGHGVFFHFVLEGFRGAAGATDARGRVTWDRLVPFVKEHVKEANAEWFADVKETERQVPFAIGSLGDVPPLTEMAKGPEPGKVRKFEVAPGVFMEFCWVPPGRATLGSPKEEKDRRDDEGDRAFETRGFWLGKYEVTQHEWTKVMVSNPSAFAATGADEGYRKRVAGMDTSQFPVEQVSWDDICGKDGKGGADSFLGRVNARPGAKTAFGKAGKFALPHEDQWEYAARGGHKERRPFYWGSSLNGTEANVNGEFPYGTELKGAYLERPTPVGTYGGKARHPWGLCDMHGNVWEWCENKYSQSNDNRVVRGGSWTDVAEVCRSAYRSFNAGDYRTHLAIGFRVAFVLD